MLLLIFKLQYLEVFHFHEVLIMNILWMEMIKLSDCGPLEAMLEGSVDHMCACSGPVNFYRISGWLKSTPKMRS